MQEQQGNKYRNVESSNMKPILGLLCPHLLRCLCPQPHRAGAALRVPHLGASPPAPNVLFLLPTPSPRSQCVLVQFQPADTLLLWVGHTAGYRWGISQGDLQGHKIGFSPHSWNSFRFKANLTPSEMIRGLMSLMVYWIYTQNTDIGTKKL